jgi:hypothetical protein
VSTPASTTQHRRGYRNEVTNEFPSYFSSLSSAMKFIFLILSVGYALSPSLYSGSGSDLCSQELDTLYDFGNEALDSVGISGDDVIIATVSSSKPFVLFGVGYSSWSFNSNGWLTFGTSETTYSSVRFGSPVYRTAGIAVWWTDSVVGPGVVIPGYSNGAMLCAVFAECCHHTNVAIWMASRQKPETVISPSFLSVIVCVSFLRSFARLQLFLGWFTTVRTRQL